MKQLSRIALASALTCGLWFGTEAGQHRLMEALTASAELEAKGPEALQAMLKAQGGGGATGFELPPMYEVKDGVAVLTIDGPTITGSAGWMRLFGIVGYDDIRAAATEAVSQKNVKSVMLHVNSPGGMAAGCEDCAAALKSLSEQKPMMTYTDTIMASAGYWLGSVGKPIMSSGTALVGSVGVLMTHTDVTKANEQAGRKVTVIRGGEFKQLNNPNEPLSDQGKAHLQGMADTMYGVFRDSVSSNLGVSPEKFDKTMGRGREFIGQQAADAGLVSQIASFDQAFAYAKTLDASNSTVQNPRNPKQGSNMKATLSAALVAQLVAGAAVASLDFTKPTASMSGEAPDAEAQTLLRAQAIEVADAVKTGNASLVAAAVEPLNARVAEVQASLATANTELGALRTTNQALLDSTTKLTADLSAADGIVHGSLSAMCVALSLAAPKPVAELKGADLLAEHARVSADYVKKFPGGRVSAMASAAEGDEGKGNASKELPDFARIAAAARKA